ncbi:TonB-dependent receptor [Ginsengibacter hankyongi]|uniref:TonB-dependent receptor n=1 Tax=Ginsengibacter hankyongi TaxID=2607284 RepID=A0A5J5IEF7_9BACT|nr:TonB-dependent receptor [Ginsengibacter hankyongi]KAA9038187.1 TonB-dependent receptor [Ginsengibacter hankyongi]
MLKIIRKKILFAMLLMLASAAVHSQVITGTITNSKSQPVADAFIHLLNTNAGTVSDARGNYSFQHIAAGTYNVSVSAVGYADKNEEVVVTTSGANLNIQLIDAMVQLDAVVVTAQKKEESLQNIPLSTTSISSKQVHQYKLWNSKELTAIVPNLYSNNSGDDRNVTSIRGIVTTSYDPAVATYIDGVNQFSLDTYISNLNDIERIEILRGPQGTLYGRNAMGGVINIITKQPTNATNGFVELNIGNHGEQRYSAGIRLPVIKNKLFFGASAMFNKRDGFYTNKFNNSSFDNQQGITGNYYLKYIPDARWAITLNVKHQNNKNDGAFPLVFGVDEAFKDPFQLSQNAIGKMFDNTVNASLTLNHSGTAFNFTSLSSWQQNHRYYNAPLDGDFSPADAVTIINNYGNKWNNVKVFTQELRFSSPANKSSSFKWTAGTYFFYQDNPTKQATHFGKDAGMLGVPDSNFSIINTTTGKNTGIAFYGQTSYSINKKLDLIAGLRYDYENRKLNVEGEYQKDGQGTFVTQPDTAGTVNYSAISPKLGLSYHVASNSNAYLTYTRGYRTGGLTQLSSDPSQPPLYSYKPEYSNNFEAGIKNTLFNDRLRLNIAVFLTHVNDAQVPTLILPDAITVTKNTGKLSSKGADLELSAAPLKGLQFDYDFGYTDAKYTSLKVSQNGQSVDLNGKKQIFTPDITSMLALQYNYSLAASKQTKLIARVEWLHLGTEYFDLANTIKQSPYSLINLRVGVSSKYCDLFLWSRNTSDKKYIAYAYDFGAVHLGDPATYGATLSYKF